MRSMRSSTWRGTPGFRRNHMRKVLVLKKKRRQVFRAFAGPVAANQVRLEEQRRNGDGRRRLALDAVVERAADDGEIAFVERQQPVLDVAIRRTGAQVEHLEIPVPIHAHAMPVVHGEEKHVHRTGHIEGPDVHAFRR